MQHLRELLGQEKLKHKLPVDVQLLECAKEELQVKKRLVEQMDAVEKEHNEHMKKLSNNMEKLTSSIADGFSLLRSLLAPPQPMYPPYGPYSHPLGEHGSDPSSQ